MWWVVTALAEQVAVESLAWKTWDADGVVRAALIGRVAEDGQVAVRVDEVLHGPSPGELIEVSWPAGPGRQDLWPGAEVLLFLRRGEDGRWSLREGRGGVVDLAHPAGASATTADCGVLATGDEVLEAVRGLTPRPASLGATVAWPLGPPGRRPCSVETAGFAASWQGSGVDVLVPPGGLDALAAPHVRLQSLTEPRAWFGVAALSAEWGGCVVGVADGLPPVVECAFPGGAGEGARPPAGLKGAARAAARATRVALGPGTRVTRVVYQATQQRAWLCAGEWTPAGWSEGALPYGLDGGVARLADAVMTTSGRGSSLRGCVGRDLAWTLPPDVAPLQVGDGWTEGLAEALPALLEGVTPFAAPDPVTRWATLPTRLVRSPDGAPHPGGDVAVRVGLPADPARPVVTTARYLVWEAGEPVLYATVSADGVPEDGVALAGPPVPAGAVIGAVVEVVAGAPEERLAVWSVR